MCCEGFMKNSFGSFMNDIDITLTHDLFYNKKSSKLTFQGMERWIVTVESKWLWWNQHSSFSTLKHMDSRYNTLQWIHVQVSSISYHMKYHLNVLNLKLNYQTTIEIYVHVWIFQRRAISNNKYVSFNKYPIPIWGNIWWNVSRKPQYKDVYRRTIEIPQCPRLFTANCCLKVHNVPYVPLNLASSGSG